MMRVVFSVLFWTFLATTCVAFFTLALLLWVITAPFDRDRRALHMLACVWGYSYAVAVPGWHVRVRGREKIDRKKAYVLVANHESLADTVLCFGLLRQFKWVSKESIFRVPILGWNMVLCRYIPLRRGEKSSIIEMMNAARMWLRRGISIMMFPEGTRSLDGQMRPFKLGAFTLAHEEGKPIVPIAISGSANIIPKHSFILKERGDILVDVLDPVFPEDFATPELLSAAVRERIQQALAKVVPSC